MRVKVMDNVVKIGTDIESVKESFMREFKALKDKYVGKRVVCNINGELILGKIDSLAFDEFICDEDIKIVVECNGEFYED
jgi:hypothetical protein